MGVQQEQHAAGLNPFEVGSLGGATDCHLAAQQEEEVEAAEVAEVAEAAPRPSVAHSEAAVEILPEGQGDLADEADVSAGEPSAAAAAAAVAATSPMGAATAGAVGPKTAAAAAAAAAPNGAAPADVAGPSSAAAAGPSSRLAAWLFHAAPGGGPAPPLPFRPPPPMPQLPPPPAVLAAAFRHVHHVVQRASQDEQQERAAAAAAAAAPAPPEVLQWVREQVEVLGSQWTQVWKQIERASQDVLRRELGSQPSQSAPPQLQDSTQTATQEVLPMVRVGRGAGIERCNGVVLAVQWCCASRHTPPCDPPALVVLAPASQPGAVQNRSTSAIGSLPFAPV